MSCALPALSELEVWFLTGSQHLYGDAALAQVARNAEQVARTLDGSADIPVKVVYKPILTRPDDITRTIAEANAAASCIGVIAWMHTFSPARMWIAGLKSLNKPLLHLHTQLHRELPWSTIDMDFMNLHQSAHGDREFGYICTRMGIRRKVVVGHWDQQDTQSKVGTWCRAAAARHDLKSARIARLGDNMRDVAVTEGDKVAAELLLGVAVNGYGVGTLVDHIAQVEESQVNEVCGQYAETYALETELAPGGARHSSLREAARIEAGLRAFLETGRFAGFTDTFEDLHGLKQLPGIATQRLMADGFGFGAEGDWKAAILVRAAKVMASGLPGGTSFMEDYTYHLVEGEQLVLGAHMLEICPSIAEGSVRCECHPLGIGGKEDPVRLVFDAAAGPAVNASLVDLGDRFRLVLNEVEVIPPPQPLPRLPVARAVWKPKPDFATATAAWIYAGGSHHTAFSQALTTEHWEDFGEMTGLELVVVDSETRLRDFKQRLP